MIFFKRNEPVIIEGMKIFLNVKSLSKIIPYEKEISVKITEYEINVYQNGISLISYLIVPKKENPNIIGQFIHLSIRVLENWALMIDGIINSEEAYQKVENNNWEGIRFQPIFLSHNENNNTQLIGQGLFKRGLHYSGFVTPGNVRLSCVCDSCKKGFNIQSYHAGFSESQYFYSDDSSETLFVDYNQIERMPHQLEKNPEIEVIKEFESKLPNAKNGKYHYFNSFRCPYCGAAYIDFQKFPELRQEEYYGNVYLNEVIKKI